MVGTVAGAVKAAQTKLLKKLAAQAATDAAQEPVHQAASSAGQLSPPASPRSADSGPPTLLPIEDPSFEAWQEFLDLVARKCDEDGGSDCASAMYEFVEAFRGLLARTQQQAAQIAALQAELTALSTRTTARQQPAQAAVSSEPRILALNAKIEEINKQLAALNAKAAAHTAAIATDKKTYASAVTAPAYQRFRLTPIEGATHAPTPQLTTRDSAAQTALQVLKDLGQEVLRPAELFVMRPKAAAPAGARPAGAPSVVVGFTPTDASALKQTLWEPGTQQLLKDRGWRITRLLPEDEFANKCALWRAHGPKLRQWADAGRRLIYSRRHCSVSAEGDAAVTLSLP